jgi:hypothetical protein
MDNEITDIVYNNGPYKMAGWTGLEPARFVVFLGRQWLSHLFNGSSVAPFSPFFICLSHRTWTLGESALPSNRFPCRTKSKGPSSIILTVRQIWPSMRLGALH